MFEGHIAEEDLVMFYYRESGPDRNSMEAHLESCPTCHAAYQRLMKVLGACDDLPVPEPHVAFESKMWHRLEPQLRPRRQLAAWLRPRWIVAAAFPVLLIGAFVAGRYTRPAGSGPQVVAMTADGRERVLRVALEDHLERSQMMLTELANSSGGTAEVSLERERARILISENRLYRRTSAESGNAAVAQLLDELERVLLDISHGADSSEIKSRIDAESLIFKLRVLGSTLNPAPAPQPLPSKETL